jgi:thioredoxin-dependent peroxiredoxin
MSTITFKGQTLQTIGELPTIGSEAPQFTLTKNDLSELHLQDLTDSRVVLNIFVSIDTSVCASSVRKFNERASSLDNTIIVCVSADLPFAMNRFCAAEGLSNVITASTFRHPEFGQQYGVTIVDGPLAGLLSRAIVVLDQNHKIIYTQQVAEIIDEPDYEAVIKRLA